MENYISELRGYLQSLRRLCQRQCDFYADSFPVTGDIYLSIEEHVNKCGDQFQFVGVKSITFNEVENLLQKHLIHELEVVSEDAIKLFMWDIIEYYGLISTALNPDGDFNPLVSNGALEVEVKSPHYLSGSIFVVVIEEVAIVMWLHVRT